MASASFKASRSILSCAWNALRDSLKIVSLICARILWQDFAQALLKLGFTLAVPELLRLSASFIFRTFLPFYVILMVTLCHKKRERQPPGFCLQAQDAFTVSNTSASVVFSRSRSRASWADVKILSNVSRIQLPTGQAEFGFLDGDANGTVSSTAQ